MPLYEHVFIARQDLSAAQVETLIEEFTTILTEGGGAVKSFENWGLRSLAFKINRNRKGHYAMLRIDAPAPALHEMERRQRINEDVVRFMTIRVDEHEDGPSAVVAAKSGRDDRRGGRDRGERGDRGDRGDRGGRDRDRGDRGDRPPREPREAVQTPRAEAE